MVSMRPCPHCGTPNSAQKRICYHCQGELQSPAMAPPAPPKAVPPRPPARPARPPAPPVPRGPHAALDQRAQFYRQLQALLHAGLTPSLGLSNIAQNIAPALRPIANDLSARTEQGGLLSTGMEQYPAAFPEWEVESVYAGEVSGLLPEAMADIATTLETEWYFRMQMAVRTLYLRVTGYFGIFVLLLVIVSHHVVNAMEKNGFEQLKNFLTGMGIGLLVAFTGLWLLRIAWRQMSRSRRWSPLAQTIIHHTPLVGPIVNSLLRLRFMRVLATLWNAGVLPIQAIQIAARATDDPQLMNCVEAQIGRFTEGGSLVEVLEATGYFSPEALHLVQTGQDSGSVSAMLDTTARYIHADIDARLRSAPMIAELGLLVILAPLIAYLYMHTWQWFFHLQFDVYPRVMMGD